MRLKVLFISPGPKMSINETYYRDLSESMDGAILTTSNEESVLRTRRVGGFAFRSTRFRLNFRLYSNFAFAIFCIGFALKERMLSSKYDLVSTYDPIKTGVIGVITARILGARFAPEVNGVYTSEAEYIDGKQTLRLKAKRLVIPMIMRWVLKRADGIKLLFDTQIDPFADVVRGKVVSRFPAYVSTSQFKNIREDKEILFVGFPFRRKGVDVLINSFKQVADRHPDWKLKILGWFPDPRELSSAISGHPQIYHHPPVYYPQVPEHIGSCAFVVLPSRSEAMGRVLVEAMACGKPRIGSNVDGIPTVIEHNVDGLLVPPDNVASLASALDRLMSDAGLRKRLGSAALDRCQSEFSEASHFRNLFRFYLSVVEATTTSV